MSVLKIILIIWLAFSIFYIAHNEYNRLNQFVYKQGVSEGFQKAVSDLMTKSQTCQPVSAFFENQTEQLINIKCLNNTQAPSTEVNTDETNIEDTSQTPQEPTS